MTKYIILTCVAIPAGFAAWNIGNRLSTESLNLGLGVVLGVTACMFPVILIAFASREPREVRVIHAFENKVISIERVQNDCTSPNLLPVTYAPPVAGYIDSECRRL